MADSFGLKGAVDKAIGGGVTFADTKVLYHAVDRAEKAHEAEDDLKAEYRTIERKVTRGEPPKMDKFEKASKECDKLAKDLKDDYTAALKMVSKASKDLAAKLKEQSRPSKPDKTAGAGKASGKPGDKPVDKNMAKLISDVEDKLDKIGSFLHQQQRRPDAGELILSLLNRRGQESKSDAKGAKRAASADAKKPGSHLLDEFEYFKPKADNVLDGIVKEAAKFKLLDTVASLADRHKNGIKDYLDFLNNPLASQIAAVEKIIPTMDDLNAAMTEAKKAIDDIDKLLAKVSSKITDKNIVKSLDGSVNKTRRIIVDLDDEISPNGNANKKPKELFGIARSKALAKKA